MAKWDLLQKSNIHDVRKDLETMSIENRSLSRHATGECFIFFQAFKFIVLNNFKIYKNWTCSKELRKWLIF